MRSLGWLGLALVACSAGSSGGAGSGGGAEAGAMVQCVRGALVLDGSSPGVPHGTYATSNVQPAPGGYAASLPAGGSIELAWSGDATSAPVAVTGTVTVATDDAALEQWCIYAPSTVRIAGGVGRLDLNVQLAVGGQCQGPSPGGGAQAVACFDPAS
jgi:hypothetical protein